jgi:hypothetical protein
MNQSFREETSMIGLLLAVFIVLHGLVHMLYFGQGARFFELQPGMVWPGGSWAFSRYLSDVTLRNIASIALIMATVGYVVAGMGILFKQTWWRPVTIGAAILSSVIFLLFWDGSLRNLDNKGGVGILINLAILASLLVFELPKFDF